MKKEIIYDWILRIFNSKNKKTSYSEKEIKPKIITAPRGARYLSDFLKELPPNTFINK